MNVEKGFGVLKTKLQIPLRFCILPKAKGFTGRGSRHKWKRSGIKREVRIISREHITKQIEKNQSSGLGKISNVNKCEN